MGNTSPGISPLRRLAVTVPKEVRDQYFGQLTKFALANNFVIKIGRYQLSREMLTADLRREDVWILSECFFDPVVFDTRFYPAPGKATGNDMVDPLVDNLRQLVLQIPGVEVTEKK
jgi:hypothetical protein